MLRPARPLAHIGLDQGFDRVDHLLRTEPGAGDLADRGGLVAGAAEGDLIGLLARALEAENADVADMMVAAGVDAAGNLDLQRADLAGTRAVAEALGNALRDRDRTRGRQRAIVEARAGDDVADEPGIRRREADRGEAVVDRGQIVERDMRQDQVLLVRDPQFVAANNPRRDRRPRPSGRRWRRRARRRSASARR